LDLATIEELAKIIDLEIDTAFRFALDSPLPVPGEVSLYA